MTHPSKWSQIKSLLLFSLLSALAISLFVPGPAFAQLTQDDIDAMRERGKKEGWTFEVGLCEVNSKYPLEQMCGDRADGTPPTATLVLDLPAIQELPSRWDWRDYDGVTPVKNQENCGSCWAFATIGPLESAIRIRDGITVDLSEQWLLSCNRDDMNCVDGGYPAHDYHQNKNDQCGQDGAVYETHFPYEAADLPCSDCPYPHDFWIEGWGYVDNSYSIAPIDDMKTVIMTNGPVYSSVHVNDPWYGYSGGVFNDCVDEGTNHGVTVVGWDDDYEGVGVWIIKNSWGEDWGDDGYIYMPYMCNRIGYRANYIDYDLPGVVFWADTTFGWLPLDVNFNAVCALNVDTWTWDFGDGDSAFVQTPATKTYTEWGAYDVTLQIDAGGDVRTSSKSMYIIAVADTMRGPSESGDPDSDVEFVIYANNSAPVNYIRIPVEYANDYNITYDSFSTVGCRTSDFEVQSYLNYDPYFYKRFTLKLMSTVSGTGLELLPGEGPIVKLYFSIPATATEGESAPIILDGYNDYLPFYYGSIVDYQVPSLDGLITVGTGSCCLLRGDTDHDSSIGGMDVVYFVNWLWNDGPESPCLDEADIDGNDEVGGMDIVYMVNWLWNDGPPPVPCP